MLKHLIAMVLIALAAVSVSPAVAQTPPTTSAGTLTCKLAPSIGLIIGSRQRMACRFVPNGAYPPEAYVGVMGTIGLDIGITAGGVMAWGVLAPTAGPNAWKTCRHLRRCKRRRWRWRWRWRQPLVWRVQPFYRSAAAFSRRVGWNQSVSWSFESNTFLGTMRLPAKASLSLHRDPAATFDGAVRFGASHQRTFDENHHAIFG